MISARLLAFWRQNFIFQIFLQLGVGGRGGVDDGGRITSHGTRGGGATLWDQT